MTIETKTERRPRYGLGDDPGFEDGEVVEVDTAYYGVKDEDAEYVEGVIVGRYEMGNNLAPYWIVDFGDKGSIPGMKYWAMVVFSCAICLSLILRWVSVR